MHSNTSPDLDVSLDDVIKQEQNERKLNRPNHMSPSSDHGSHSDGNVDTSSSPSLSQPALHQSDARAFGARSFENSPSPHPPSSSYSYQELKRDTDWVTRYGEVKKEDEIPYSYCKLTYNLNDAKETSAILSLLRGSLGQEAVQAGLMWKRYYNQIFFWHSSYGTLAVWIQNFHHRVEAVRIGYMMVESGLHISPANENAGSEEPSKGEKRVTTVKRDILKSRKKLKTARGGAKRFDYTDMKRWLAQAPRSKRQLKMVETLRLYLNWKGDCSPNLETQDIQLFAAALRRLAKNRLIKKRKGFRFR